MRIYENDEGEKFVDSGETTTANVKIKEARTPYFWKGRVHYALGDIWCVSGIPILRPATPEEVAESEKPKLTLPLSVGQVIVCRDGVERTVEHMRLGGRGVSLSGIKGVYSATGLGNHDVPGGACTEPCSEDAVADSPRWKPEKKDEGAKGLKLKLHKFYKTHCGKKLWLCRDNTDANGADSVHLENYDEKGRRIDGCGSSWDLISEWPSDEQEKQARAAEKDTGCRKEALPVTSTGCTQLADSQEPKPAAPPAILPEWTDGDVRAEAHRLFGMKIGVGDFRELVANALQAKNRTKPDTRPDKPQRDARSDSFVWRRDWRVG